MRVSPIRRPMTFALFGILSALPAFAGDPPKVITNADLPKNPHVSVVGTLKVDEGWRERLKVPAELLALTREREDAERAQAADVRARAERDELARADAERRRQLENGDVVTPLGYGWNWGAWGAGFGWQAGARHRRWTPPQSGPQHMEDPLPPMLFGFPGRDTRHLGPVTQTGGVMPRFVAPSK